MVALPLVILLPACGWRARDPFLQALFPLRRRAGLSQGASSPWRYARVQQLPLSQFCRVFVAAGEQRVNVRRVR